MMRRTIRQLPVMAFLRSLDYLQITSMLLLLGIGLIFIHSTGLQVDTVESRSFYLKQLIWISIGSVLYVVVSILDYREIPHRIVMMAGYFVSLLLLTAVLFCEPINGATRWIDIFGFRLQPSEPAKLMVIVMLGTLFSEERLKRNKFLCALIAAAAAGIPFLLIAIEPDLGSAIILLPVSAAMFFCFGIKWRYVLAGLLAVIAISGTVLLDTYREDPVFLRSYQRDRIKIFLNPDSDKGNRGHNAWQAKLAVAAGGMFGKGIGKGTQNELGFLPHTVSNNDFIFAVLAEETGFFGVTVLLILYALLIYSILRTAFIAVGYGRYIAAGVAALMFCHIFVNIGMSIGITPVTGLPLPLVSYGGSFILTSMITLALVQSIGRYARKEISEGR